MWRAAPVSSGGFRVVIVSVGTYLFAAASKTWALCAARPSSGPSYSLTVRLYPTAPVDWRGQSVLRSLPVGMSGGAANLPPLFSARTAPLTSLRNCRSSSALVLYSARLCRARSVA